MRQQYFLASASLQDVIRQWVRVRGEDFSDFAAKNCFQLNDTHPTIGVAELMRILMDDHGLKWDDAWAITSKVMAYTNHTLLPEALERWPVWLFRKLLPRVLDIIYEINARFLACLLYTSSFNDQSEAASCPTRIPPSSLALLLKLSLIHI